MEFEDRTGGGIIKQFFIATVKKQSLKWKRISVTTKASDRMILIISVFYVSIFTDRVTILNMGE